MPMHYAFGSVRGRARYNGKVFKLTSTASG